MPRGRAGLQLIAPERVREAFRRWYSWRGPTHIAEAWLVSERTIRRWLKTGLPTCYGKVWITPQEWKAFDETGKCPRTKPPIAAPAKSEKVSVTPARRTRVDRDLSATRLRTGARSSANVSARSRAARCRA